MSRRKKKEPQARPKGFSNRPFEQLRSLKVTPPAPAPKPKAPPPTPAGDDELRLFLEEVKDALPLPRAAGGGYRRPPPDVPHLDLSQREAQEVRKALERLIAGGEGLENAAPDELIEGLAAGADPLLLERLRRGEFAVRAFLDLHGMDRQQARQAVEDFVTQNLREGRRCLLIICGRGNNSPDKRPVLKTMLQAWLNRSALRKKVLAWCTARPCDGGAGALYLLLKRPS
jgi:DNA-nicking Smr family endonuclease